MINKINFGDFPQSLLKFIRARTIGGHKSTNTDDDHSKVDNWIHRTIQIRLVNYVYSEVSYLRACLDYILCYKI